MPTRTKKSEGAQQQSETMSLASTVHFGPPFAGSGPFGGTWSKFPPYPPPPPAPCPGFWTAIRYNPTSGGIVAQLGAQPGAGTTPCIQYVYYEYNFTAQVPGPQTFVLTMNLGPITRRPRGGQVSIWGLLQIFGPGGHWPAINEDLPSNTGIALVVNPTLQAKARYTLRFGVAPIVQDAGFQSYGEAILNSATLEEYLPFGVQSAQALRSEAAMKEGALMALLNPNKRQVAQETSLADAIKMGMPDMK